jgi:hypothetical protein
MSVKQKKIETKSSIQAHFIEKLKEIIPPGIGLAEELSDVLSISLDSAYRRIRGETEISIAELYLLTKKYTLSIDDVFSNQNDTVTFAYTKLTDSEKNFEIYLTRLSQHLKRINTFEKKRIHYVAEEIPLFYSFFSEKLTEFKLFYWQRSVLNIEQYQQQKFNWGVVPQPLVQMAHHLYKEYLTIPSVEVWTDETVLTGIKQILFYFESGILTSEQTLILLEEYKQMIIVVQQFAENGSKQKGHKGDSYQLYNSEVVLGTNCIYVIMGEARYSYISFNTLNSLTTTNPEFCEETEHWMRNLERKSTLISGVAEKQRYQFFSKMYKVIDEFIEKVKH